MKEKLIQEASAINGDQAFDKLFGPVKKAISNFGKTIQASAKLIGNDVGTFMKLTLHWKTRSLSSQREVMNNWKGDRTKHLKDLEMNTQAMIEGMGPEKLTVMAMFPGAFLSSKAVGMPQKLLSKETRSMIGEYGMDKMPVIGKLFDGGDPLKGTFWDEMWGADEDPGTKKSADEIEGIVQGWLVGNGYATNEQFRDMPGAKDGLLKKIFYGINDVFLFSIFDSKRIEGDVLVEGKDEDEDDDASQKEKNQKKMKEVFEEMVPKLVELNWPVDRNSYVEEHKKVFESTIKTVENILSFNTVLATTNDPDEFFKVLEEQSSKQPEFKDINASNLKEKFDGMVKTLAEDEKVMAELRKELEKSGELKNLQEGEDEKKPSIEISEKEKPLFESHLKKIALDNVKGGFLPAFKEGAMDLYDDVRFRVTDGLQEKTLNALESEVKDNALGIEYIKQIRGFQKRLDESLSKLK